jgi:hypothetical protein
MVLNCFAYMSVANMARAGSTRWYRGALLVCVLVLTGGTAVAVGPVAAQASDPAAQAAVDENPCPGGAGSDAGWVLSTTTFDTAFYRHAVVGNGYLAQRVPRTGMGYVATGEPTGWPLYTPRYDGAFVAGMYARDPDLAGGRDANGSTVG